MRQRTYTIRRKPSVKKIKKSHIILIAAAAGIAVLILCLVFCTNIFIDKSSTLMNTEKTIAETCDGNSKGILSVESEQMTFFDTEGFVQWTAEKDATYTDMSISDSVFALYNQYSAMIYNISGEGLFKTEMEYPIDKVICGNENLGVLVTQREDISSSSFLHVYNLDGQEISVIEFSSKKILQIGFYGSTDTIYALSLDTTGVVPVCYITTYKSDGTITGSISINTEIIDKVLMNDTNIFASGTNSLTKYSYFGEQQNNILIYGWKMYDSFVSGSDILMLYTTRSDQTLSDDLLYSIKLIDSNLNETMIYFAEALQTACCSQNKVYAFGANNIYIYNTAGTLTDTITMETEITKTKKLHNGYAIIWDESQSYILKLF